MVVTNDPMLEIVEHVMANDPIFRVFLLLFIAFGFLIVLRPDLFIKIFSYGRYSPGDVDQTLLRVIRVIAGVSAVWGVLYLAWVFFKEIVIVG